MLMLAAAWFAGLLLEKALPEQKSSNILVCYFFLIFLGLLYLKQHPDFLKKYVHMEWYPRLTLLVLVLPVVFLAGQWRMKQVLFRML